MNKKFLSAILFGALVATTGSFVSCNDYDSDIASLKEQIKSSASLNDLNQQVALLQAALDSKVSANEAEEAVKAAKLATLAEVREMLGNLDVENLGAQLAEIAGKINCDYPTKSIYVQGNTIKMPIVEEKPQGRLVVEQNEYVLGKLRKKKYRKQPYTFEVRFRNEGTGDLHILSVISSCECTRVKYNKDVYAENEEGTLTVFFDPSDIAPQDVLRSFVIQTDGQEAEKEVIFSATIVK